MKKRKGLCATILGLLFVVCLAGTGEVWAKYVNTVTTDSISLTIPGTALESWHVGKNNPGDVTAYLFESPNRAGTYEVLVSGRGEMMDWAREDTSVWHAEPYKSKISAITIEEGVTSIGDSAFSYLPANGSPDETNTLIKSLHIPASVVSIGEEAFMGIQNIESLTFAPNSQLKEVKWGAFEVWVDFDTMRGNTTLQSLELPDSIETIGAYAFSGYPAVKSLVIPSGNIGDNAFYCPGVSPSWTSLVLGDKVTGIGEAAFSCDPSCENKTLKNLVIPNSVTSIGGIAFGNISGLETLVFEEKSKLETIGGGAFACDADLTATPAAQGNTTLKELRLPESIRSIGTRAFSGYPGLQTLEVKSGAIGNEAFHCFKTTSSLSTLILDEGVTSIGKWAFGCSAGYENTTLSQVVTPKSVTSIGNFAFARNTSVKQVTIKSGSIGNQAFCCYDNTPALISLTLEEGVTSIGEWAFGCNAGYENTTLSQVITPKSVTSIGDCAFARNTGVKQITIKSGSIGKQAFRCYNTTPALMDLTLEEGVTSIGEGAFAGTAGYENTTLKDIHIPSSVTVIGDDAFRRLSNLSTLTFAPNSSLQRIGKHAFQSELVSDGRRLSSLTLPASVKTIDEGAFERLPYLSTLGFEPGSQLETIGDYAFSNWTVSNAVLKKLKIPSQVTSIGISAFYNFSGMTTLDFSEAVNLQTIGKTAFQNASSLTALTLPTNVKTIGDSCFSGARALKTLDLSQATSLQTIGNMAFQNASSLTTLTLPPNVETIGNSCFSGMSALRTLDLSQATKLTNIPSQAFYGMKNVTGTIVIPDSVQSIGDYAFAWAENTAGCERTIYIGAGVKSLGTGAFYYMAKTKHIYFMMSTPLTTTTNTFDYVNNDDRGDCWFHFKNQAVSDVFYFNSDSDRNYTGPTWVNKVVDIPNTANYALDTATVMEEETESQEAMFRLDGREYPVPAGTLWADITALYPEFYIQDDILYSDGKIVCEDEACAQAVWAYSAIAEKPYFLKDISGGGQAPIPEGGPEVFSPKYSMEPEPDEMDFPIEDTSVNAPEEPAD